MGPTSPPAPKYKDTSISQAKQSPQFLTPQGPPLSCVPPMPPPGSPFSPTRAPPFTLHTCFSEMSYPISHPWGPASQLDGANLLSCVNFSLPRWSPTSALGNSEHSRYNGANISLLVISLPPSIPPSHPPLSLQLSTTLLYLFQREYCITIFFSNPLTFRG